MKNILSYIGKAMLVLGVLAIILDFFNRVPKILFWIYNWGNGMAWVIKIGLVIAGIGLLIMLSGSDKLEDQAKPSEAN